MKTLFAGKAFGSGAIMTVGLGFVPDWVRVRNLASDIPEIYWDKHMAANTTHPEGIKSTLSSTTPVIAKLTAGLGITPYAGGDPVTAVSDAFIVPLEFLPAAYHGDQRGKGTGTVTAWTLGSSGNRTGNFNQGVDTTYVGVGSVVWIDGVPYTVQALSNDGDAANEVTLDRAAPSGVVERITFKADLYNAPLGLIMPAGFVLAADTDVNVDSERVLIEAGLLE